MTVSSDTAYFSNNGDGVNAAFAFNAALLTGTDLIVELVNRTTGLVTPQTEGVHYSVAIAADWQSAVVTMLTPPAATHRCVRRRRPNFLQLANMRATGRLPSQAIEQAIDRIVMSMQAVRDAGQRSIRFSDSDPPSTATLPPIEQMKGKYVWIGLDGLPIGTDGPAGTPVAAAWAPVIQSATLAAGVDLLPLMPYLPQPPRGRLTLATGVPVMGSTAYTGKTTVYWTPHQGCHAPVWNGTRYVQIAFAEISNDLTSAAANVGAAAAQPYSCYDFYLLATGQLYRSPRWRKAQTFTVTSASPGVFTTSGNHGFYEGQTVFLETTGTLYTGLAALTVYFVHVVSSTTFNVSTSLANLLAGTYVNTSGAQSGVHTVAAFTQERGTGAGSAELELLNGIHVNKYAMTNGPVARYGTYVGTGMTDASSQMNWQPGAVAAGGTPALLHLWNAYNRVPVKGFLGESANSWNYTTINYRPANQQPGMRASVVAGLREDALEASHSAVAANTGGGNGVGNGVGFNSTSAFTGHPGYASVAAAGYATFIYGKGETIPLGSCDAWALESGGGSGTSTWYGDNNSPTVLQTGLHYEWRA